MRLRSAAFFLLSPESDDFIAKAKSSAKMGYVRFDYAKRLSVVCFLRNFYLMFGELENHPIELCASSHSPDQKVACKEAVQVKG